MSGKIERRIVGSAACFGIAANLMVANWGAAAWSCTTLMAILWAWSLEDRLKARQQ